MSLVYVINRIKQEIPLFGSLIMDKTYGILVHISGLKGRFLLLLFSRLLLPMRSSYLFHGFPTLHIFLEIS